MITYKESNPNKSLNLPLFSLNFIMKLLDYEFLNFLLLLYDAIFISFELKVFNKNFSIVELLI